VNRINEFCIIAFFTLLALPICAQIHQNGVVQFHDQGSLSQLELDFLENVKGAASSNETKPIYDEMDALLQAKKYSLIALCMVEGNSEVSFRAVKLLSAHTDSKLAPFYLEVLNQRVIPRLGTIHSSGRKTDEYRRNIIDKLLTYYEMERPETRTIDELLREVGKTGDFSRYENLYFTNPIKIKALAQEFNLLAEENEARVASSHADDATPSASKVLKTLELESGLKESAEVVVTEPIKEDLEQSSNWWLWLIGLLIVVGGVLVFRRKN